MGKYELRRGIRNFRGIGARTIVADTTKTLMFMPLWPGETVVSIRLHSISHTPDAVEDGVPEINFLGMIVKANDLGFTPIIVTDSGLSSEGFSQTASIDGLGETMVKNLAAHQDDDYYGGDAHASSEAGGNMDASWGGAQDQDFMASSSESVFKRERLMTPFGSFEAYGDQFNSTVKKNRYIREPSFLMFWAYRFEHAVQENWNWENIEKAAEITAARSAQKMVWNPEYVEGILENFPTDSTETANAQKFLVAALQGDNYIEAGTLSGASVDTVLKYHVKVNTPIRVPVLGNAN